MSLAIVLISTVAFIAILFFLDYRLEKRKDERKEK